MAYARFSDFCYRSDVYVYETLEGWMIFVRDFHYKALKVRPNFNDFTNDVKGSLAYGDAVKAWFDDESNYEKTPLPEEYAGKTFIEESPGDCAERLKLLQSKGVYVPQNAIEALLAEVED